ncbi:MAG TPA: tetratricopeptide repeat protein [Gaiellaceae bacterium]|nr:tetratricopeptide repeat protein [Gaiellaceae bacterium]
MARAAVKAKQLQKAKTQPAKPPARRGRRKHAGGGNPNQQLFFVRMRRSAKPAYLILAVLFAATFAFLGVGSGSSGLDQLFSGLNIFHHSGTSVSSAEKATEKHPSDPKAWRTLATAYESHNDTASAISALQQYTVLKPKDAKAWSELAGLQMTNAQDLVTQYQNAYANEQLAAPSQAIRPSSSSPLGRALGTDPIEQAAAGDVNTVVTVLAQRAQGAFTDAVASFKQVAKLKPNDPNAEFQLAQAAQTAGDTATEISAYKAYVKLNPSGSTAAQVRALIKQLQGQK